MLQYQDSFDVCATAQMAQRYAAIAGSGLSLQANGRTGVQALNAVTAASPNATPNASIKGCNIVIPTGGSVTFWIGAALQMPQSPGATTAFYVHPWLFDQIGGTQGLGMEIRGDGSLLNQFAASAAPAGTFQFGVWQYVEMQVIISQAALTIEVTIFVNDVQVADGTGTVTSLPANITGCQIGIPSASTGASAPAVGTTLMMDDMYLCDNTGLFCNARAGDVDIYTQMPAGPGRVNAVWANNGGAGPQNWQNVSQNPPTTTSYVTDSTAGDEECFALTPPSGPASGIIAMQVSLYAQKSLATGSRSVTAGIGNGSAEGMSSGQALTNAWQYYMYPFSNDPVSGGAFDQTIPYQAAIQTVT